MAIGNQLPLSGNTENENVEWAANVAAERTLDVQLLMHKGPELWRKLYLQYHRYLHLIANRELDQQLQGKLGPSDVVQETLLKAHQNFGHFRGATETELREWLRTILLNNIYDVSRRYGAGGKRDVRREHQLYDLLSDAPGQATLPKQESPSQHLLLAEQTTLLRSTLEQLSAEHRQVILLRNIKRMAFGEIGKEMDRSGEAARKLWLRAIDRLRELLGASNEQI